MKFKKNCFLKNLNNSLDLKKTPFDCQMEVCLSI